MTTKAVTDQTTHWRWKRGWIAFAICMLCAEGAVAGGDRSCMPSFDLGILYGQMLMMNQFGIPEIMGIIAGIPAYILAGFPESFDVRERWSRLTLATILLLGVVLTVVSHFVLLLVPIVGTVIGFWTRTLPEFRRYWIPIGILMAFSTGVIIFSFGHYGQNNCWP